MDPGVVGFDGLVGSDTCSGFGASLASDPETNKPNKWYGSGLFLKQERSNASSEEDLRSSKLAKTERNPLLRSNATLFSDGHHQQQMLSFSSPKSDSFLVDKATQNAALPYSYHPFSTYSRNPGGSMHGALASVRGAFTPSQWMELEHQALIYKYITANVPVPTHLLIPIKKALDSAGFYNFSNGLLRPNALGWGGIHLGLSSNCTDPEPGRCRRTDGKKWRCSRDAVVDQKYCERHMNRGRHRSRKPVEQPHSSTTATAAAATTPNNIQLLPSNTINRVFVSNKENNNGSERLQDGPALPMLPPTLELKSKENNNNTNPFLMQKNQIPYDQSSSRNNEFGLVTSDSLLNPSHKTTSTLLRNFSSSEKDSSESQQHHSLRHFIDESPKTQSHHHHPNHRISSIWQEPDMQPDRTQLSISIPMSSSDLMSFTSAPSNEKLTLSPLRLSKELDPIQMGLGVGSGVNESTTRQANWIPITWESSMGGPLGEVLQVTSNCFNNHAKASGGDHHHLRHNQCGNNNTSALNLMKDGWDNSPPLGSSPTGVLQKTAFGSLSNSSAGSSPRADNNKEGTTLCNELLPAPL